MTSDNEAAAGRQILVTIGCVIAGTLLGAILQFGLLAALGYDLERVQSEGYGLLSPAALATLLATNQVCGYLLPGVVAAVLLYRSRWLRGVHLSPPPAPTKLALGLLCFLGTLYLTAALAALNASVELADWQVDIETDVQTVLERLIRGEGVVGLTVALLLIAVLPALGEELVFRGLLQPALIVRLRSSHLGVWVTAAVFGAVHLQFAGLLPRIFVGGVLGFLAFYSQRLWVPVAAHALFNGAQVAAVRAGALDTEAPAATVAPDSLTLLLACAIAAASLYFLLPLTQPDAPPPGPDGGAPTLPAA